MARITTKTYRIVEIIHASGQPLVPSNRPEY